MTCEGVSGPSQAPSIERNGILHVFWTRVGDIPERILLSTISLSVGWQAWKETEAIEVLRPERQWEGADAPLEPSVRSTAYGHVNQLRDPAVFVEDDHVYLLYSVAGESGIEIAEVESNRPATNISLDSNRFDCLVEKSSLGVEPRRLQSPI